MVQIEKPQDVHDIIQETIKSVTKELIDMDEYDDVEVVEDINSGYCLFVANKVAESLDDYEELKIWEGGGMGFLHVWVSYEDVHYDAEDPTGSPSPDDMNYFKRHGAFDYHEVGSDFIQRFRGFGKGG